MKKNIHTALLFLFIGFSLTITAQEEVGIASFYHTYFNGKKTASGELYSDNKLTCAHKTLPLGTLIKVTNLDNDKWVIVKVNDRGPYVKTRIVDLSRGAAQQLGYLNQGTARVSIEVVDNGVPHPLKDTIPYNTENKFYVLTQPDTSVHLTFGIKIGSYEDASLLFNISTEIRQKYNATTYIQTVKLVKGSLYRLFVGNFNAAEEADELYRKVKKKYPDAYVVEYDKFK